MSTCKVCGSPRLIPVLRIDRVPALCNRLFETEAEALAAQTAAVDLRTCRDCTYTFNAAFQPERVAYSPAYENALEYSPRFMRYADELAARLVARSDLHGKRIVEVGCGRGAFLSSLCRLGKNQGVGYDPSFPEGSPLPPEVTVERVAYTEQEGGRPVDFLVCRQCLEHIEDPVGFLRTVRNNIQGAREAGVFFEVPSLLATLQEGALWDVIYEHCSYFTPSSLARAFEGAGFHDVQVNEVYEGQYLALDAVVKPRGVRPLPVRSVRRGREQQATIEHIRRLQPRYRASVARWRARLQELGRLGKRVVVWGAGSKGTAFLNAVHPAGRVEVVVDISPRKSGKFIPVTAQRIVPPSQLLELSPDLVLLMNPIYHAEVEGMLRETGLERTGVQVVRHDPADAQG